MDDELYILTESALMMLTLKDFGIDVSNTMAKAIYNTLVERLIQHKYLEAKYDSTRTDREVRTDSE